MTSRSESYNETRTKCKMLSESWDRLFTGVNLDVGKSIPKPRRTDSGRNPNDVKQLLAKDMSLFGRNPETDPVVTVVCSYCGRVFLPHAFRKHIQERHGDDNVRTRPPDKPGTNFRTKIVTNTEFRKPNQMTSRSESHIEKRGIGDMLSESWDRLFTGVKDEGGKSIPKPRRTESGRNLNDVKRLPAKDMSLYGQSPETDPVITVVCSYCGRVFLPHAFRKHILHRHGEDSTRSRPPNISGPPLKTKAAAKKISPQKKTSKSSSTSPPETPVDESVVRSDVDLNSNVACSACLTLLPAHTFRRHVIKQHGDDPSVKIILPSAVKMKIAKKPSPLKKSSKSSSSPPELIEESAKDLKKDSKNKKCKSPIPPELEPMLPTSKGLAMPACGPPELLPVEMPKNSKKKVDRKPDKVYDPNKHCGVINDTGKPCLRSILCKVHLVALKRAVQNRSMPYDALTKLLKSQNDEQKRPKVETATLPFLIKKETPPVSVVSVNEIRHEPSIIKQEEPPAKRIKTEEVVEKLCVLPSNNNALIDEILISPKEEIIFKTPEEDEPIFKAPVVLKQRPLIRWCLDVPQLPPTSCSPPPVFSPDEIPWHSSHPRPLATNTFGCRLVGGLLSRSKKLDVIRKQVQSIWSTQGGLNDTTSKNYGFITKQSPTASSKKSVVSPSAQRRKIKGNSGQEIISGLLQRAKQSTTNGVPIRLFQENLSVQ